MNLEKKILLSIVLITSISLFGIFIFNKDNKPKTMYQIEYIAYDSVGNIYHVIKRYDHLPTSEDSVEFYK